MSAQERSDEQALAEAQATTAYAQAVAAAKSCTDRAHWTLDGPFHRMLHAPRSTTPSAIETAARNLFRAICGEHERGETFSVSVSVCTNALREALGETYPDGGEHS